ncbi:MAG: FHA domain-containing protein, partial [Kiritimatiellaeota bacterium]|nr:FHA domain-containing protein [Kiritimatiellota bacterium]
IAIGDCRLIVEAIAEQRTDAPQFHRLEQLNRPEAGRVLDLRGERVRIGSDPSCEIVCGDPLVSHRHAELSFKRDGSCWAKDTESRNGSTVNKAALRGTERMLRDGDVLSVAYLEFRFLDKTAVHVRSYIGAKIAAAAATVAVGVVLYYAWNVLSPSAITLIHQAEAAAREGCFEEATQLIEKAATARSADSYAVRRRDVKGDLKEWETTLAGWEAARARLREKRWTSAGTELNRIAKWPPGMKEEEGCAKLAKTLNAAFITARDELSKEAPALGKSVAALLEKGQALRMALDDACRGGTPGYLEPLSESAARLLEEVALTRTEWERIEAVVLGLGEEGASVAEAVAAIEALRDANEARGALRDEERKAEQEEPGVTWRIPILFSGLVGARCTEILPTLRELREREAQLAEKVRRIAMREGVEREAPLAFEKPYAHEGLRERRAMLERKHREFDDIARRLEFRLKKLDEAGFKPETGKLSLAMATLLNPTVMDEAFAFLTREVAHPSFGDEKPACSYDAVVGVCAFKDFLYAPGDWKAERGEAWTPRVTAARLEDDAFRSLLAYIGAMPTARWQEIRDVPGSKVRGYVDFVTATQNRLSDEWREAIARRRRTEATARGRLLARGMLVMMDPKPAAGELEALENEWRALRDAVSRMDDAAILEQGLPGMSKFKQAWDKRHENMLH